MPNNQHLPMFVLQINSIFAFHICFFVPLKISNKEISDLTQESTYVPQNTVTLRYSLLIFGDLCLSSIFFVILLYSSVIFVDLRYSLIFFFIISIAKFVMNSLSFQQLFQITKIQHSRKGSQFSIDFC